MIQTGHTGDVSSLAFSPDGKILATAGNDLTLKLWDVESGLQISELKIVNSSPFFRPVDLTRNDFGFGFELGKRDKTPLAAYITAQLRPSTLKLLGEYNYVLPKPELLKALADDLNEILKSESLYTPERFAGISLSAETLLLLEQNPRDENFLARLNRMLLSNAFPDDLSHNSDRIRYLEQNRVWCTEGVFSYRVKSFK